MRNLFLGAVAALILVAAGVFLFAMGGFVDITATKENPGAVNWLLATNYRQSLQRQATAQEPLPALDNKDTILQGTRMYLSLCSGCHTPPGAKPTAIAQGLNPAAPDITRIAPRRSPSQVFWITKNGIRMTGMPAFGPSQSDSDLWALVAFIQHAAGATPRQFHTLLEQAQGKLPEDAGMGHRHPMATPKPGIETEHGRHAH